MRFLAATATALILSLATIAPLGAQRGSTGRIQNMTATSDATIPIRLFTLTGTNPCTSVEVDYGDGEVTTHPIKDLPATVGHEYRRTGDFTVRAKGVGNCDGTVTASVRITTLRPPPPPPTPTPTPDRSGSGGGRGQTPPPDPTPTPTPPQRGGAQPRTPDTQTMRFAEMDRNRDGVISRSEWNGSDQSFAMHDWNGDGRLAGDEVRLGATPPARNGRQANQFSDWTEVRFHQLDLNRDGRLSRNEWRYDLEDFLRLDRNRDNALTLGEFLVGDIDDDRGDRFEDLDLNHDNRIDRREWHGSVDTFRWLDRNNDGVLSRAEVAGSDTPSVPYPGDRGNGGYGSQGRAVTIAVSSQQSWTDTGITLRAGDSLNVRASGTIMFSGNSRDSAGPDGARGRAATPQAPMPDVFIGALIARIGNSPPFLVGLDSGPLRAPRDGRLYLGVNDDVLRDNRGEFRVVINR